MADRVRKEVRNGIPCVKHQIMSGSNIGDDQAELLIEKGGLMSTLFLPVGCVVFLRTVHQPKKIPGSEPAMPVELFSF